MEYEHIATHLITCSPEAEKITFTKAFGTRFVDENEKEYINLNDISCVLGYGHPTFTREMSHLVQTKMMGHPGMFSPDKEQLIRRFMEVTHGDFDKIFFAGSGGEVVDWSLKAARRCTGRDGIISFTNALHGRSFAGAFISGTPIRKEGFGSGLQNITFWEYPEDGRPFEPACADCRDIAAVIIEPYQALGGMVTPSREYWQWLRKWTREQGILLIFDEIQTGFGKTGSFFAYEECGIVPDMLLAGKGMSNGFGLGALLMSKEVGRSIQPREMSGGSADNDLMCSIVNLVFDILRDEDLLSHVRQTGRLLQGSLQNVFETAQVPFALRGEGLFLSVELPRQLAEKLVPAARARGVMLGRSGNRLLVRPPLVITAEDVKEAGEKLQAALQMCMEA